MKDEIKYKFQKSMNDIRDGYAREERDKATADLISRLRDHVAACGKSLTNKGKALRDEATAWLEENE